MPGAQLDYDNSAFYYFIMTVLAFFLIPFSYYSTKRILLFLWLRCSKSKLSDTARTEDEQLKFEKIESEKRQWSALFTKGFLVQLVVICLGWCLLFFVMGLVTVDSEIASYDPFKILEVDPGATVREIKKAYRKQSLIWHPDKNNDPTAGKRFHSIAKAYAALTDPEAKENWEKYGNPDGRQALSISIGLPQFLIESENQNIVLMFYMIGLIICIPTAVWYYYSWSQQFGNEGILFETERAYMHPQVLSDHINMKHMPEVLAMATEFQKLGYSRESDRDFQKLKKELDSEPNMIPKFRPVLKNVFDPERNPKAFPHLKAFYLIHAHLNRMTSNLSPAMTKELHVILKTAPLLIDNMLNVALMKTQHSQGNVMDWLVCMMNILNFRQCIVQGIWLNTNSKQSGQFKSSLLQLPHFGESQIHHVKKARSKGRREEDLRAYLRSKELRQTGKKRGQAEFTPEQEKDTQAIMDIMPDFEVQMDVGVDDVEDQYNFIAEGDLVCIDVRMNNFEEEADAGEDTPSVAPGMEDMDKPVCPPVHSYVYPFDLEETWHMFLIWEMPGRNKKEFIPRLMMHRELTGQDRVDSLRAYKEIDGLLREVSDLRVLSKEAGDDAPTSQTDKEEPSSDLRQRKGPLPGEKVVPADSDNSKAEERDYASEIFELEQRIFKLRQSLKTRLQFISGPPREYNMRVIIKSGTYVGLDHTGCDVSFDVTSRDKLPEYKVHEEDKALDLEPSLYDAMSGNWPDEEDDDFGSDDEDTGAKEGDINADVGAEEDDEGSDFD